MLVSFHSLVGVGRSHTRCFAADGDDERAVDSLPPHATRLLEPFFVVILRLDEQLEPTAEKPLQMDPY